jgi:hypothetical protein
VSPYALNDPVEPDQGFTISVCSTAIDMREALLRSHMLLSGNRNKNQEPQKLFSPSLASNPKNFLSKEALPTEVARASFFLILIFPHDHWLANKTEKIQLLALA